MLATQAIKQLRRGEIKNLIYIFFNGLEFYFEPSFPSLYLRTIQLFLIKFIIYVVFEQSDPIHFYLAFLKHYMYGRLVDK